MQLFQRYKLITLAGFLLTAPLACRQESTLNLQQGDPALWFYDGHNKFSVPPTREAAWEPLPVHDFASKPINPNARAFFLYPLPEDPRLSYLILSQCSNVTRIFQDQQLILERSPELTYPQSVRSIHGEPFLTLPNAQRPSQLFLETFYADQSGYRPNCHTMRITDQDMGHAQFLAKDMSELGAHAIVLFISFCGFLLYAVKGHRVLLYFSVTAGAMSLTAMTGTNLAYVLFAHTSSWRLIWHLLLAFAPIPFFLFLEIIMPTRSGIGKKLALFNAVILAFFLGSWLWEQSIDFDGWRRSYYKILSLEALIFMPFALKATFGKSKYAKRLGISLFVLIFVTLHDMGQLFFSSSGSLMVLPWALVGFMSLLFFIVVQKIIHNAAEIPRTQAKLIIDPDCSLQSEVDRQTSALNRRNSELEGIHAKLEDHYKILVNQKEKVTSLVRDKDVILSRIAELRHHSIPKIFSCLQQLHLAFDENSFTELTSHIKILARTLEPAAHQYEKSYSISKRQLLILDSDRKHQRIYRMAIGGSKVDLQIAENSEDFLARIQREKFDLLILHHNWLSLTEELVKISPHSQIVVMSSEPTWKNLAMMRLHPHVAHVIPLNLSRLMLQQILLIHLSKLLTGDIFGIEKYLARGFEVKEKPLLNGDQSGTLMRQLGEDLTKMGLESDGIEAMVELSSCLIRIKKAHALLSHWSPNIISNPLQQLRYGFDANLATLSIDLCGQLLSQQELITFLERHIQEHEAGRSLPSLSRLLHLADAVIINSDGNQRQELIVLLFLEKNPHGQQPAAYFHFAAS